MTNTQQIIQDAIDGGWKYQGEHSVIKCEIAPAVATFSVDGIDFKITKEQALLDPSFWQAVGKTRGWNEGMNENHSWFYYWHHFIDHLADGLSVDEALGKL